MSNNVIYVHDGPLYKDDNGDYYAGHFNDNLRLRYLNLGDSITFLLRCKKISLNNENKLHRIHKKKANFVEIPNFKSIRLFIKYYYKASRIIEREVGKHDIIVARLPSAAGQIAIKYAKIFKKPYIVEMVGCTFDAYWNYGWKGKLIAHYKLGKIRKILTNSSYVIYVTQEFLQNRYPSAGYSIACSNVELGKPNRGYLVDKIQKLEMLKDTSTLKLCTIAAIDVPYKGQDDVIKALYLLKKKGLFFKYYIVGNGNKKYLDTLIKKYRLTNQVKIVGAIPHYKIFEYLNTIDLYIQPSKQEGLPRSLIEAMSVGLPAIGANTAGIPELIDSSMTFDKGNVKQLANILSNLSTEILVINSKINFEKAKEYQSDILESRRLNFYNRFLQDNGLLDNDQILE